MNNVPYIPSPHMGTGAQEKNSRFTLLPQKDEPILWDFGSAARHHQLHCPWLGERSRAGIPSMRGAMTPGMGRAEDVAKKIRIELEQRGLHKEPLGVDIIEPDVMIALQRDGIEIVNSHALMCEAREIKTEDEIELIQAGRLSSEVVSVGRKAKEFGFPNEEAAFGLQMGHGIGLAIWERPMISRLVSLEHPHEIKPGMVFALETFWPSTDGWSAARIEEEIVVTKTGHEVITRFPAEELLVAGAPFVTVGGTLPIVRETEAPRNPEVVEMIARAARAESEHEKVGAGH